MGIREDRWQNSAEGFCCAMSSVLFPGMESSQHPPSTFLQHKPHLSVLCLLDCAVAPQWQHTLSLYHNRHWDSAVECQPAALLGSGMQGSVTATSDLCWLSEGGRGRIWQISELTKSSECLVALLYQVQAKAISISWRHSV